MASGAHSMDLWPKLRRRIKGCKTKKGKSMLNTYASRGLEKFSVVYAEVQARRDSMVEKMGAQVSMVRSMSRSARGWSAVPNHLQSNKDGTVMTNRFCEDSDSAIFSDSNSAVYNSQLDTESAINSVVENVDTFGQECGNITNATVSSILEEMATSNLDESVEVEPESVELMLKRQISLQHTLCQLELRGGKSARMRRRSMNGRERRWKHVDRITVVSAVTLGVLAEKTTDMAGSILGVLFLTMVIPFGKGKQHLSSLISEIAKFFRGLLQSYLFELATKRLDSIPSQAEDENKCVAETSSPHLASPRRNSIFDPSVSSPDISPPSPLLPSIASEDPTSVSPALLSPYPEAPVIRESFSRPVTPVVSTVRSRCSPTSNPEKFLSPSNKLSQFKSKLLKSFPRSKGGSDVRDRAFSMPSKPTCANHQGSLTSQSERWDSSSPTFEILDVRTIDDRVTKKKSFLQRRLLSKNDEGGSLDTSDSRSSSFSRSRFGSLRIEISRSSHGEFDTTSTADSPRTLRIGSLRISTSMKESPRRSIDHGSSTPCSPGQGRLKASISKMESMRGEYATPRQSGLSNSSPFPAEHEKREVCETRKRQKHEAWLAVVFLVALLFLIVGRALAVLATSICFLFLSQLDKFKQSEGAGWDKDASRRATSISRKLATNSSYLSPRTASPRTPCTPNRGSSRIMTPAAGSSECRRSLSNLDHFIRRSKKF